MRHERFRSPSLPARRGGTHLNDMTMVHPIFDEDGNILEKIRQSDHEYGAKCAQCVAVEEEKTMYQVTNVDCAAKAK